MRIGRRRGCGINAIDRGDIRKLRGYGLAFVVHSHLGMTLVSGAASAWADVESGVGHTVVQGNASFRPVYTVAAGINGRPELQFNGTSHRMAKAATGIISGNYTLFLVVKVTAVVSGRTIFGNQKGDGSGGAYFGTNGTTRMVAHGGAFAANGGTQPTTWQIVTQRKAVGTNPTLLVNGINDPLTGAGTGLQDATVTAAINIGANTPDTVFAAMSLAMGAIFTTSLPDTVAQRLKRGAAAIYGLA